MSDSFAAAAIGAAERAFPVLRLVPVEDPAPLARPPVLAEVPRATPARAGASLPGLAVCAGLGLGGVAVLGLGRRSSTRGGRRRKMREAAAS
jgi:hypothetical protein